MPRIIIIINLFILLSWGLNALKCPAPDNHEFNEEIKKILGNKNHKNITLKVEDHRWNINLEIKNHEDLIKIEFDKDLSEKKSSNIKHICYYNLLFESQNVVPLIIYSDMLLVGPIYVGHGIRKIGSLSHEEITNLKQKYKNHPVLSKAFDLMEGSDLAVAVDLISFLKNIGKNHNLVNKDELYKLMTYDMNTITQAAECFSPGDDSEKVYRPFLDLLHALGNQKKVLGYSGRQGIKNAIEIIKKYGDILEKGELPAELKAATSKDAIHIRIALFYINLLKNKAEAGEKISLRDLTTFCPASYFGQMQNLEEKLKHTSFYENGQFYAPSNGYVKNASQCNIVNADKLSNIDLHWDNLESDVMRPRNMIFADCSGFAQAIARQFHPDNVFLNTERQMSYQLAPLYDALANKKMKSKDLFYDIDESSRKLSAEEIKKAKTFSKTIRELSTVYEPIINPIENIKPGDIIIERGPGEGHVMIAVEQSAENKNNIKVIELTSYQGTGFNWTNLFLVPGGKDNTWYRVLRIITK